VRVFWFAMAAAAILCVGTAPSHSQSITAYRHLILDGHYLKWGEPVLGRGATVTFALLKGPAQFGQTRNCSSMTSLDDLLSRNEISTVSFMRELDSALAAWSAVADIWFSRADPAVADILIGAQLEPAGYAFANVEYDKTKFGAGLRSISRSLVCFNPVKPWKIGFDGDLDVYDLRYVLMHEIGHAIGLNHPPAHGQLMTHKYGEEFRELQPGDIRGIETLYGTRRGKPGFRVGAVRQGQSSVR
jgi:Matrixin